MCTQVQAGETVWGLYPQPLARTYLLSLVLIAAFGCGSAIAQDSGMTTGAAPAINTPLVSPVSEPSSEANSHTSGVSTAPAPRTSLPKPRPTPEISSISTAPPPRTRPKPQPTPENPLPLRTVSNFGAETTRWSGSFLGATIGYGVNGQSYGVLGLDVASQIQIGRAVFGVTGGIQGLGPENDGIRTNWTATVLARVGYAASDQLLPYVAFGPAVTAVERAGLPGATVTGWTLRAGIDYRLTQDWSATASLGYFGYSPALIGGVGPEINLSHAEIRAGVVYRLPASWWTK